MTGGVRGLELAAAGMDLLGVVAGAWYVAARYRERVQRKADRELSSFEESSAASALLYPSRLGSGLLSGQPEKEEDQETGAEELLAARMTRFQEPVLRIFWGWCEWMWRSARPLGWLRVPLLVPAWLVLFVFLALLCSLLLPIVAIGYLFDIGQDFRLRIVVLAFTLGIALQILAATIG